MNSTKSPTLRREKKNHKSPLGRVCVPTNTEEKWKQLMVACQKHECDYRWCGDDRLKPTEFMNWERHKENTIIYFAYYKSLKLQAGSIEDTVKPRSLSFETAIKKLAVKKPKKKSWFDGALPLTSKNHKSPKQYKVGEIYKDWKKLKPLPNCTWAKLKETHGVNKNTLFVAITDNKDAFRLHAGQITKLHKDDGTRCPWFAWEESGGAICESFNYLALLPTSSKKPKLAVKAHALRIVKKPNQKKAKNSFADIKYGLSIPKTKSQPKVIQEKTYEWDGVKYTETHLLISTVFEAETRDVMFTPEELEEHIRVCRTAKRRHKTLKF